jgi:hypothetical protein
VRRHSDTLQSDENTRKRMVVGGLCGWGGGEGGEREVESG